MTLSPLTLRIIELIAAIPKGKVATYGGIAAMAGSPRAARQVVRILHSSSRKNNLPWHRVINKEGKISLPEVRGAEQQKALLEKEGITFDSNGKVDLAVFLWRP